MNLCLSMVCNNSFGKLYCIDAAALCTCSRGNINRTCVCAIFGKFFCRLSGGTLTLFAKWPNSILNALI